MTATNFTKPSVSASGFGIIDTDTDALLLQNGDYLLLQDGESHLLLGGSGELNPINFAKPSISSTNFS
jgi:hypothetical protein